MKTKDNEVFFYTSLLDADFGIHLQGIWGCDNASACSRGISLPANHYTILNGTAEGQNILLTEEDIKGDQNMLPLLKFLFHSKATSFSASVDFCNPSLHDFSAVIDFQGFPLGVKITSQGISLIPISK